MMRKREAGRQAAAVAAAATGEREEREGGSDCRLASFT